MKYLSMLKQDLPFHCSKESSERLLSDEGTSDEETSCEKSSYILKKRGRAIHLVLVAISCIFIVMTFGLLLGVQLERMLSHDASFKEIDTVQRGETVIPHLPVPIPIQSTV